MAASARTRLRARLLLARHRRSLVAALVAIAVASAVHSLSPGAPELRSLPVAARDLPAGHRLADGDLVPRPWSPASVPDGVLDRPRGRVLAAPVRRGEPVTDARVAIAGHAADAAGSTGGGARSTTALSADASAQASAAEQVAVAVRLTDPASALVAAEGERVDVIAGPAADTLAGDPAPARPTTRAGGSGPPSAPRAVAASVLVHQALVLTTGSGSAAGSGGRGGSPGLLGALQPGTGGGAGPMQAGAASGVVVLRVSTSDALRLAAAAGTRTLSLARHAVPGP